MIRRKSLAQSAPVFALALFSSCSSEPPQPAERIEVAVPRADGTSQPAYVITPDDYRPGSDEYPLLVSLHSWSFGHEQRQEELEHLAQWRGWIYLFPNFRGRNDRPEACGSELARQDILDAVEWTKQNYPVDRSKIYLTGSSGGGHMSLLMAARHPEVWTAVSAWVPITDLAAWHDRHAEVDYGEMLRACTGGTPGSSPQVDAEYRDRSPLRFLSAAKDLPIEIAAGVRDGHQGSVPIRHSLLAFNELAGAHGAEPVSDAEIAELSTGPKARLANPQPGDRIEDPAYDREIILRRTAGPSRITIFEGGHEGIASAQVDWLRRYPAD